MEDDQDRQLKQVVRFGKFVFGVLERLDKKRPFISAIAESLEEVGGVEPPKEPEKPSKTPMVLPPEAPTNPATPKSKKCIHKNEKKHCPECFKKEKKK